MQTINFIQKTNLLSSYNAHTSTFQQGLFEDFLQNFNSQKSDIFTPTKIIVQNIATENWLKDYIAKANSICANISFTVLLSPFIEQLYKENNSQHQIFDFSKAKFIIYDYICGSDFLGNLKQDFSYVHDFLFYNGKIDFYKAFQLAHQLQTIFHEYLYLRTQELLNSTLFSSKEIWQEKIWQALLAKIGDQKTYLDIYQFFMNNSLSIIIPKTIYIFGLSNIYSSQLDILKKISKNCTINWYYLAVSNNYYGDLFNSLTKAKLQQKVLFSDVIEVSDLYLTDGNPLVANFGQQSREFIELLLSHEIIESELETPIITKYSSDFPKSLLHLIQGDISYILNRIDSKLVLFANQDCIIAPLESANLLKNNIKINICHNKMREVQVLFNEICELLIANPNLTIADIVVLAPIIDDYTPYIHAVFDNEYIRDINNNDSRIPYVITNNSSNMNIQIIKTLKAILNTPYHVPISYFLELINQTEIKKNLDFSQNDLERINIWLQENKVRWGLDASDYKEFGYSDFDINSFKRFLVNLSLGFCIPEDLYWQNGTLPLYSIDKALEKKIYYVGYDNLENSQLNLCNKLISLINIIERVRNTLYCNHLQYSNVLIKDIISLVEYIKGELVTSSDAEIIINNFIGNLRVTCPNLELQINLPIFNSLIEEIFTNKRDSASFTGKLTFSSMQSMRNIPFAAIYILGMNFGEFPRNFNPNKLSIISKNWALADRNFNLEDKQLFLDILLAARDFLFISYIGRDENTNSEKKPSTVVNLLLETIKNSIINGKEKLVEITYIHSLHPFYNNKTPNYSVFWASLNKFINVKLSSNYETIIFNNLVFKEQQELSTNLNCQKLINTFLYTNTNLYSLIGLNTYNKSEEVNDYEDFYIESQELYRKLYQEFNMLDSMHNQQLFSETLTELKKSGMLKHYLYAKGVLSYDHLGSYQLDKVFNIYLAYSGLRGNQKVNLDFTSNRNIKINDQIWIDNKNIQDNKAVLVICDKFINTKPQENNKANISYALQVKSLILYLLAKNATFTTLDGNLLEIESVQLRLIDRELNAIIYQVQLIENINEINLFDEICKFYLDSLTTPILVHKKSIEEYISLIPMKYKNLSNKEIQNYRINKAINAYLNKYENHDLEALKIDPVFAKVAENYFSVTSIDENSIVRIGELLLNLVFIKQDYQKNEHN